MPARGSPLPAGMEQIGRPRLWVLTSRAGPSAMVVVVVYLGCQIRQTRNRLRDLICDRLCVEGMLQLRAILNRNKGGWGRECRLSLRFEIFLDFFFALACGLRTRERFNSTAVDKVSRQKGKQCPCFAILTTSCKFIF